MTQTQKLREALQAISHIDDTTNHSVDASAALDRIGQIARQALALPTAAPVGEREAFEKWAVPNRFDVGHKGEDGSYLGRASGIAWDAWQARAALGDWHLVEFLNQIPDSEIRRAMNLFLKGRP